VAPHSGSSRSPAEPETLHRRQQLRGPPQQLLALPVPLPVTAPEPDPGLAPDRGHRLAQVVVGVDRGAAREPAGAHHDRGPRVIPLAAGQLVERWQEGIVQLPAPACAGRVLYRAVEQSKNTAPAMFPAAR
jgi:hypothetical protein